MPEVGLWDLDTDGDLDVVLSRAGILYVGTGVQIIENMGYGSYASSFYPIVTAPDDYVAEHEGNEWNNFIENFQFHDVASDGQTDIAFLGGIRRSTKRAIGKRRIFQKSWWIRIFTRRGK